MYLAVVAVASLSLYFDTGIGRVRCGVGPAKRWIVLSAPSVLLGGALCWCFRWRAVGAWVVVR